MADLGTGKADLKHLKLKKSVLERFGLPVEIVAGECCMPVGIA